MTLSALAVSVVALVLLWVWLIRDARRPRQGKPPASPPPVV